MREHFKLIDKPTFFGALLLLLLVTVPLALFLSREHFGLQGKTFMTDTLGVLYLTLGGAVFFMTHVIFSILVRLG